MSRASTKMARFGRFAFPLVLSVALTLTTISPSMASTHTGIVSAGLDPYVELANAEQELRDNAAHAERLAVDHRRAEEALADAREVVADVVVRRRAAEVELDAAEAAVVAADKAVQASQAIVDTISRRLSALGDERDREDGKLKVEARESYKEGSGDLVAAAAALEVLVLDDDPIDALHKIDTLSRVAARRADGVAALAELTDEVAQTRDAHAAELLEHRDELRTAEEHRDQSAEALQALLEEEEEKLAARRAAEDLVAELAASRLRNDRQRANLGHLIDDLTGYVASLRNVSANAGVPAELARYGNGRVPSYALASIGVGSHRLWGPAAGAFKAMRSAAARDGVHIGVTDSYRSYAAQVQVAGKKGLYSEGGLAARPGSSDHGWGLALDLDLSAGALRWMRVNARNYGFVEDTPREPWHWGFHARP